MKQSPEIVIFHDVPTALAVFPGSVILPARLVDALSDDQLKDVVIHEYAHILNRDPVVGLLQFLASILYWPHPLIHVANRALTRSREEVCDNYVLRCSDPVGYSQLLLFAAQHGNSGPRLAAL